MSEVLRLKGETIHGETREFPANFVVAIDGENGNWWVADGAKTCVIDPASIRLAEDSRIESSGNPGQVNSWTSVNDRLPDPGERVLATNGAFVGEAWLGDRGWLRLGMAWTLAGLSPVTHWQPMPAAPKDEMEAKL